MNVNWNDANAFCSWLARKIRKAARLPLEAEWEYACRAGSVTTYYSGNDAETLIKVGNVADGAAKKKFQDWDSTIAAEDGYVFTAPVGQFLANRFGLYDMHGNAWGWCQDWYGPYGDLSAKEPVREDAIVDKNYRVMQRRHKHLSQLISCGSGSKVKRTPHRTSRNNTVDGGGFAFSTS